MRIAIFFLLFSIAIPKRTITTIAGGRKGAYSGVAGAATAAAIEMPNQITLDKAGNIYIAEYGNNVIRKISKDGIIALVAGNGKAVHTGDGGMAHTAGLFGPCDVAFDKFGNMYIADLRNNCIRKVSALGIISTIAGIREAGFSGDGDPAVKARLHDPIAIVFDNKNNLLIAERANHCIRSVSPSGIITTIAGGTAGFSGDGGPAVDALINSPTDIAVDSKGNIYIADCRNNRIRKISLSGRISTFAGTGSEGYGKDGTAATNCSLNHPYGIFIDSKDNIYFSDNGNAVIRKIDNKHIVTTVAGTPGKAGYAGDGGPALKSEISNPGGLAIDQSGNLLLADFGNNAVRKITGVGN